MGKNADRGEITELTREECVQLLRTQQVGRFAVARRDHAPIVVPVNYVIDGETVVFRTDRGAKLDALQIAPVSFEVDDIDLAAQSGWSVLVTGWAHEATPWEVEHLTVSPWGPGEKSHWVRIAPERITGRRVTRYYEWILDEKAYM